MQATPARELLSLTELLSSLLSPVLKRIYRSLALITVAAVSAAGVAAFYGLTATDNFLNQAHRPKSILQHTSHEFQGSTGTPIGVQPSGGTIQSSNTHSAPFATSAAKAPAPLETGLHHARISHPVEIIPPTGPGGHLFTAGHFVTVESFTPLSGEPGPALTIVVSPASAERVSTNRSPFAGFRHEEELFRTKWGWAAHEAVSRAAREEAQTGN